MPTGMVTAYDLNVGVKVSIDEAIYTLSPLDSPMLTGMDSDGLSVIASQPVDQIKFQWQDESILTPRSSLAASLTTGAVSLTLASADERLKFSTGDVIRVVASANPAANEIIRVTGYSVTTATDLVVTRGYDGTSAVAYDTSDVVIGLGTALPEGSDPEAARTSDRVMDYNFTQIYGPTLVHMSATEQLISKYGVPNEMARQLFNRTKENAIAREQSMIYGRRSNSTTTEIRTSGGLDYFIQTNVDTTSTELTVASLAALQQEAYDQGGVWDRIMANPKSLVDLNLTDDTQRVQQTYDDNRRGRTPVMVVDTEFGRLMVVRNRWVHPGHAFGFSRERVIRRVMRPLTFEKLAKTGDSDKGQIVCEEGLAVKGEEHMGKFVALAY